MALLRKVAPEEGPGAGQQFTVPAPVLGLNTRDAFNIVRPDQAREMENFIPDIGTVRVRPGYEAFTNANTTVLRSCFTHRNNSGIKILVAGNGKIMDASVPVAVRVSNNSVTYSKDYWSTKAVGTIRVGCNGTDLPWKYDGKGHLNASGWTGVDNNDLTVLRTVSYVRSRLWFTITNSGDVYYAPLLSTTGLLTKFGLSQATSGGRCIDIGSFSIGGGTTSGDQTVFIMETGEILIYSGDPSTDFTLIGKFIAPMPIITSYGSSINIGGELIIMTVQGPIPVSSIIAGAAFNPESLGIWGQIAPSWQADYKAFGTNDGWSAFFHNGLVYFNIMTNSAVSMKQYVLNMLIPAWTTYKKLPVGQFAHIANQLYFSEYNGSRVFRQGTGADLGSQITAFARQGFMYPLDQNISKHYTTIKPNIFADGPTSGQFQVDTDFESKALNSAVHNLTTKTSGAKWGDPWGSSWATSASAIRTWKPLSAYGLTASPVVRIFSIADNCRWEATDIVAVPAKIF